MQIMTELDNGYYIQKITVETQLEIIIEICSSPRLLSALLAPVKTEKERIAKKVYGVYTLVQKEDKDFLYNGGVQFVSTTMPAKQK